ncbi:MAG: hypothetical protein JWN00_309 [Actinomycetia bacterium]|nr:hypothetical protein [Actinomycetes bacterium]
MSPPVTAPREGGTRKLSHLSIELGHLTPRELGRDVMGLSDYFRKLRPWHMAAIESLGLDLPRVSTCVLIDDYFTRLRAPAVVLPNLIEAAERAGLAVDYIVRESGLVQTGNLQLAMDVSKLLPVGMRSPSMIIEAGTDKALSPSVLPSRETSYRHSISVDVELWDDRDTERTWSCALLAAIWQLLRLGLIGLTGPDALTATRWADIRLPGRWAEMPAVIQVNPDAQRFIAYQTFSILPPKLMAVEHAVRMILSEAVTDAEAWQAILSESHREGLSLAKEHADRVSYTFISTGNDRE